LRRRAAFARILDALRQNPSQSFLNTIGFFATLNASHKLLTATE